ncbi:hypothetical protein BKA59DRAFT_427005 [Fusarium tricinctum]|uniref:Transcription factor domain-containing protein n=1 Tax=Fusarium tricinctum TaxID=61284 RepID=A0A8K0RND0_9HYPO|nr:hypothetical protein BKA59DRAFT_427005 [Fusarium tricinctum]
MSAPRSRQYRRVAQACDNCRRLEQLEDKLDSLINRVGPQSMQEATPSTTLERNNRLPSFSASTPNNTVTRAIEFYFRHIHRQPLWLFDDHSLPNPDTSEDLICAVLAISTIYGATEFSGHDLQSPDVYSKTARKGVMSKIAEGNMTIQNIQTLCLLAYFNLVSGDIAMAGFDIALAKNMIQLIPDRDSRSNSSTHSQEKSKLFWSLQFLSFTCGAPVLLPLIQDSIDTPRLSTIEAQSPLTHCVATPRVSAGQYETLLNIWPESLKVCGLWSDIRIYVARCIEGLAKYPWKPDSDYTKLCSRMMEYEMAHPLSLSYNAVNFPGISPQNVQANRSDWLPWLRIQVTYHTIHCVLNHPSLYTAMTNTPRDKLGGNTFWRTSYEKALRHCTWISRLLRTADEKGLRLADPFFAQAAAIASTLHLYWTRTSDSQLQASSMKHLEVCRKLIGEMAMCWPVCRRIEEALNRFIETAHRRKVTGTNRATIAATKTSLIWTLIDVAAPQFPNFSDPPSEGRHTWGGNSSTEDEHELPQPEVSSPPIDMRESTVHYASPPAWVMGRAESDSQVGSAEAGDGEVITMHNEVAGDYVAVNGLAWGPWENLGPMGENFCMNMDWWDMSQF